MIEEIITKQYKTKDSSLFDTKEEAEKYEEVLEFFNYLKSVDEYCLDCKSNKVCRFNQDLELRNCDHENDFVRILLENYFDLKKFFDVDELNQKIEELECKIEDFENDKTKWYNYE